MGYASKAGRAFANPTKPEAFAICDRCGLTYNHSKLVWQWQYAGLTLINKRILVCTVTCLDKPSPFLKTIVLPPDPLPVKNPRPEFFVQDEGTIQPAPQQPRTAQQLYAQQLAGQGLPIPDDE